MANRTLTSSFTPDPIIAQQARIFLRAVEKEWKFHAEAARALEISPSYLAEMLHARKRISPRIAARMGALIPGFDGEAILLAYAERDYNYKKEQKYGQKTAIDRDESTFST